MVGQHHGLSGYEFEQIPIDNEGQGILECYSPWGHRVRHNLVPEKQQLYTEGLENRDSIGHSTDIY